MYGRVPSLSDLTGAYGLFRTLSPAWGPTLRTLTRAIADELVSAGMSFMAMVLMVDSRGMCGCIR